MRLGEILGTRGPIHVYMDNKAACNIAKAKGLTQKVKHLEVCDAYICILREQGIIKIVKVASNQNHLDIMTKAFGSPKEFVHVQNMLFRLSSKSAGECCGESSLQPQDVNKHPSRNQMSMDIQAPTEQGTPP